MDQGDWHCIDGSYRQVARLNTCDTNDITSVDDLTSKALLPLEDTVKHFESLFLTPISTEEEASIPYVRLFPHVQVLFHMLGIHGSNIGQGSGQE